MIFLAVILVLVIVSTGFFGKITGKTIVDNGDYITDSESDLIWQKEWKGLDFIRAIPYCEDLDLAEYSDWRLPTIDELETISDVGNSDPFKTVTSWYLSSTETSEGLVWSRDLNVGGKRHEVNKERDFAVRCVRDEIVVDEIVAEDVGEQEVEETGLFSRFLNWIKGIFG